MSHLQVNQGFETDTIRIHCPSRLLVKHMHDLFQFEPVGQWTQVTLKLQIEPTPLLKPFEHLVAKRTHQHTQGLLEHLKTMLEHKQGEALGIKELQGRTRQRQKDRDSAARFLGYKRRTADGRISNGLAEIRRSSNAARWASIPAPIRLAKFVPAAVAVPLPLSNRLSRSSDHLQLQMHGPRVKDAI